MQNRKKRIDDLGNIQLFQDYKNSLVTFSQLDSLNDQQISSVQDIANQLAFNRISNDNKALVDSKIILPKKALLQSMELILDLLDLIDIIKRKHPISLSAVIDSESI